MDERKYEVLYYKRTQKVHKSRGVTKIDGVLTIVPSTGRVLLQSSGGTEEEDDCDIDEQDRKLTWKEKQRQHRKKGSISASSTLFSGIQRDVAHSNLDSSSTIQLGGYEVEIVVAKSGESKTNSSPILSQSLPVRRTVVPGAKAIVPNTRLLKPKRLLMQQRTTRGNLNKPKVPANAALSKKAKLNHPSTLKAAPAPSLSPVPTDGQRTPPATDVLLHIPLPNVIRTVLRPHQVSGVDFLWKTLRERKGCILGDGKCMSMTHHVRSEASHSRTFVRDGAWEDLDDHCLHCCFPSHPARQGLSMFKLSFDCSQTIFSILW